MRCLHDCAPRGHSVGAAIEARIGGIGVLCFPTLDAMRLLLEWGARHQVLLEAEEGAAVGRQFDVESL